MKKSNSKGKAQSAFKKLGAVALITATLAMFFTACNQTGGVKPKPTPKPKHAITFSVDSTTPNGTLKAKADGVDETSTSPINVEAGKTVTFTATANSGYRVKGWTLDGKPVAEAGKSNTYAHIVTKVATITVSFEAIPTHNVTFSVEGGNGTLTAKTDGIDETSTSPINVEAGKTVTFTATASDGYRVKGWTLYGNAITEAGTNTEYKLKVSKPATIKVSFEAIPTHNVTFSVEGGKGTLKAKADGIPETETSPITVEAGKTVTFTAQADDGYRVKGWTLDGNAVNGTAETYTLAVTQLATITVSFELIPQAILTLNPNKLTIEVKAKTADGSAIEVEGCTVATLASEAETTLTATGTKVILKGKITELNCSNNQLTALNVQGLTVLQSLNCHYNQLTALNVQGCTSLQKLNCDGNQLNAKAMTELLNALPAREASDNAWATLYTEMTGDTEGNCKDFTKSAELKAAFDGAKKRKWKLEKINASGSWEVI